MALKEKAVLSEDPESLDALYNHGNVYMDEGKYELAAEQFRRAVEISPGHHAAFYKLGYALEYLGRIDEAIEAYDKAVKTSPNPDLTRPYEVLNFEAEARE